MCIRDRADIFSRLKYMERRGSGFKKILADYEGQVEFDVSLVSQTMLPIKLKRSKHHILSMLLLV